MRLAAIFAAILLSGCASHTEPLSCPAPEGQLLLPPKPLERIPDGPMSQQDFITQVLNDWELFRVQRANYQALQSWGVDQCKWPKP